MYVRYQVLIIYFLTLGLRRRTYSIAAESPDLNSLSSFLWEYLKLLEYYTLVKLYKGLFARIVTTSNVIRNMSRNYKYLAGGCRILNIDIILAFWLVAVHLSNCFNVRIDTLI